MIPSLGRTPHPQNYTLRYTFGHDHHLFCAAKHSWSACIFCDNLSITTFNAIERLLFSEVVTNHIQVVLYAFQDAQLPSSLEYRLRNDESARKVARSALLYLEESLQIALSTVRYERTNNTWSMLLTNDEQLTARPHLRGVTSDTEGVGYVPTLTTTSELIDTSMAIRDGVTHLFELSMVIRRRPEKDEYSKAALVYPIDATADIVHVSDKYPLVKAEEKWLMERLGTAITRRTQYLWYRKEHQKKLEEIHSLGKDDERKAVWSGEKASTYLPDQLLGQFATESLSSMGFAAAETSQPPRTEYADSSKGKDRVSDLIRTPLLPKDEEGQRVAFGQNFECPYCW